MERHERPPTSNGERRAEAARLRREELPTILRDRVRLNDTGYIQLILSTDIALGIAQDLDLAIEKAPGLGYGG